MQKWNHVCCIALLNAINAFCSFIAFVRLLLIRAVVCVINDRIGIDDFIIMM